MKASNLRSSKDDNYSLIFIISSPPFIEFISSSPSNLTPITRNLFKFLQISSYSSFFKGSYILKPPNPSNFHRVRIVYYIVQGINNMPIFTSSKALKIGLKRLQFLQYLSIFVINVHKKPQKTHINCSFSCNNISIF